MTKPAIRLSSNLGYLTPNERSYKGSDLNIKLIPIKDFKDKDNFTDTERLLLQNELAGVEPIEYIIQLDNNNKVLGEFTRRQLIEMLNDIGFNVFPKLSGAHGTDFSAVMNVKGFVLPGWSKLPDLFSPKLEKFLLTKFAPGKERLHIRVFENNDGSWYITAHTDFNLFNFNLYKVYKAHLTHGTGDYRVGTALMTALLNDFKDHVSRNEFLSAEEVINTTKSIYRNGVDAFYNKLLLILGFIYMVNSKLKLFVIKLV